MWDAYEELRLGCSYDDYGGPLITWEAILAWCKLIGLPLMRWEVNVLIYVGQAAKSVAANAAVERMKKVK